LSPAPTERHADWPLVVLAGLAIITALYIARDLIIPLVLAALLALLLRPLLRRLQHWHLPNAVSSFLIVLVVALLFVAGMLTVAQQGQAWLAQAPQTVEHLAAMLPQHDGPIVNIAKATQAVRGLTQPNPASPPLAVEVHSSETTYSILGASGHFVGAVVIILVVTFFLLTYSDSLLNRAVESQSSFAEKRNIVTLLYQVENGVSRYLVTVTMINSGLGIVTALMLWMLGMPNPLLWGAVAATLNYVPHVGAFLFMVVLFVVGAVAHESLAYGAGVAAMFALITFAESYFITPLVLSKSLRLSPLAVILSVIFWGWLWGIAGGLMAAPLLAVLKIVVDQTESLRPLGEVLSGDGSAGDSSPKVGLPA
jgi:predicted PurR-regulated permease PerM